jgi:6-phosphogluconolactonase
MHQPAEIRVLNTPQELFQAAAAEFIALAEGAIQDHGRFTVALSGGSTPRGLFSLLASEVVPRLPWDKIFAFWGDERHVPPDHPDSNYLMAREALLAKIAIPAENVFRVPAENKDPDAAAKTYEETLKSFFGLQPGQLPRFDLILLGLGPDGHTASLFPGSAALAETTRLVVANWVEKFKTFRITFTYPVLNNAANVMFLVSGADKASPVHDVLKGKGELPAGRVRPENGRVMWLVDRAAGSRLG